MAHDAGGSPPSARRLRYRVHDRPLFLSGLMFFAIGVAAILIASKYPLGSASNMGPGYFPILLSVALCGIGTASVFRSVAREVEHDVPSWPLVPALSVAFGVLVFGVTVERFGLVVASALLLLCVGFGQIRTRPLEYLVVSIVLVAFSSLLFVKLLGLPLELWP